MNIVNTQFSLINLTRGVHIVENKGLFTTKKVKYKLNMSYHFPGAVFLTPLFLVMSIVSGTGYFLAAAATHKKGSKYGVTHETWSESMIKRIKHNTISRDVQKGWLMTKTIEKNLDIRFLPFALSRTFYMLGLSFWMAGAATGIALIPAVGIWGSIFFVHTVGIAMGVGSFTHLSSFFFPMLERTTSIFTAFLVSGVVAILSIAPEEHQMMYIAFLHDMLTIAFKNKWK